jgi:hypothetical protein
VTSYLKLARNCRDRDAEVSNPKILHLFEREDELNPDALEQPMASIARHRALAVPYSDEDGPAALDLEPVDGCDLGGVHARLAVAPAGIDRKIRKLAASPRTPARRQAAELP